MNDKTEFVEVHLPCPCGMSSDAYALNADGSGKCFSCGDFFPNKQPRNTDVTLDEHVTDEKVTEPKGTTTYDYIDYRGLYKNSLEFYSAMVKHINGEPYSIGYIYPNGAVKVRVFPKKFYAEGPIGETHLFGMNLFDPSVYRSLTIVEGENDAIAGYQMLYGRQAVVSVKNAATAFGDVKACREWINSFDKIILCLDNDKPGREATRQITNSGLFDYEKLYKVTLTKHKDAHAYLENGDAREFVTAWENAKRFTPDSIINSFEDIKSALSRKAAAPIGSYPFTDLNDMLIGLHLSEFILLKGYEKIGKTEVCRAIVHEFLKNTDINIATIFLEEDQSTTIQGVATYERKQPCALKEAIVSDEDILESYKKALGGNENRLYIHTHFSTDDEEEIVDNIRFLVTVAGCKLVLLDNLTMLTTGREGEDERMRIDRIVRRLRDLVNELHFCLVLVAHVNDDGKTRGSRLPDKIANTIIYMERNKLAPDVAERNTIKFMVEGARGSGTQTGPAGKAFFDPSSFTLRNVIPEDDIKMPDI